MGVGGPVPADVKLAGRVGVGVGEVPPVHTERIEFGDERRKKLVVDHVALPIRPNATRG